MVVTEYLLPVPGKCKFIRLSSFLILYKQVNHKDGLGFMSVLFRFIFYHHWFFSEKDVALFLTSQEQFTPQFILK